jgi:hypothetical protein
MLIKVMYLACIMKPLLFGALILLTSCTKTIDTPTVTIDQFSAFIQTHQFGVSGTDDTFTFDPEQGCIVSVMPCRTTYVPYRIYQERGVVKFDWVNLSVQYETFVVSEIAADHFTLKSQQHYITYTVIK